ncbi:MAG: DUF1800 domain-containing protein [Chitinophagaceae bacterium]|jgi:uncharacterized protein (DUF1800 family)|nr:DUF1800 domain-containing protein [Chitinophagaceae bacterium]MBP6047097.1 DUF1800 domain-containing protein [Ferruginibacter sp.]NMD28178.1 DUF1800 domain-containing protein [Bacteroidota bacterium]MBK8929987.1 DUF1800 domain-containing protein [Chitinophagaceae bacterium]MBL0254262.1 DUF1800 domain-containing protein [Chitinophagaceae bacterium]
MASNRIKNQHLLWRAGFGPMAENSASLENFSTEKLWEVLIQTSAKKPQKIEVARSLSDGLVKGVGEIIRMEKPADEKKAIKKKRRQENKEGIASLNLMWLDTMINSEAQLREKMSFFWHGHFATRVINSYFQQELLHIIRENALGNFGELLRSVSKSPTMLQFLNNQQNKKSHPNENFAREVMELFTMGRGNYTEDDIKEAARAFTGWGFNMQGEFVFRRQFHDEGKKTVLAKSGNFDGDDVLTILLSKRETAEFITRKIYRFLVNDNVEESRVKSLAADFYDSGYEILPLLHSMVTSDWFYDEKNIGSKIKSPIELLAGIRRYLPMSLDNDEAQMLFQKVLGQVLFYPPNVAGWPGGMSWIDSTSLMVRLQVPQVYAAKESILLTPKIDDDVAMGSKMEETVRINRNKAYVNRGGAADIEWNLIFTAFEKVKRPSLVNAISNSLVQSTKSVNPDIITRYSDGSSREAFIKSAVINIMSTPEYQMC